MTWVCLLNRKSEAFGCFRTFKELVENETGSRIKCLRSDNGGEFTLDEFNKYCEEHGIKRQFSVVRTPQQNGVVERSLSEEQKASSLFEIGSAVTWEQTFRNLWAHFLS